ncbi:MAG TPA: PASTA domain-containing protein [Solirubrobacteraceae bacterium]|nr:PASTA domain-containing protein [Solirubrobacteraceae bacterium]
MPRLWIAAIAAAVALVGIAPSVAHATTVTQSTINTWTSSEPGTPPNAPYLISYDNQQTTLTVTGQTNGGVGNDVDIVCYYGNPSQDQVLATGLAVQSDGSFSTATGASAPLMKSIAGHACRLRAVPTGGETTGDVTRFAGPQIAVSEAGLPSGTVGGKPYDYYVVATTFSGSAAWDSAGSCGPYAAPFDPSFGQGNFAIDCMGSLLGAANLPGVGNRSEVQVDGQNAYDAASAQALFAGAEDLGHFPSLTATVVQDPTDGTVTSQSTEGWVVCPGLVAYPPTSSDCPQFAPAGIQLQRDISTSDGGLVVTMTDTWSSTDGQAHSLDLLYDDYVGLRSSSTQRGYEFPGQSAFSPYGQGTTLPGPGTGPGSILVRTNLAAADGDTSEAVGAITYSSPPSGFEFVSNNEFEEHQALEVPAGGSVSLTYVYSTGYTVAQVEALALATQDRFQSPAIAITSPGGGTMVSTPTVTVTGNALAGSGIASLSVGGQSVSVAPGGSWSAAVPLSPGSNTITALATDRAGASVQAQVTIDYQPPPASAPPPVARCEVPRIKGMKLPTAERAIRRAHCRVGRIRHEASKKVRKGRAVATSPPAGRLLRAGNKLELFVSKGP